MQSVLFTGKGGVGKSSLAAALAWQLAEAGYRVLASSFDPAHNLGDIFGLRLGHKPRRLQHSRLYLQETDLERAAQAYLQSNAGLLEEVYSYTRTLNMERYFKILRYSPGVEEYAALTALERLFSEMPARFDVLVIDTPPTGLTLRILALPQVTLTWLARLIQIRQEILAKRHTIHHITGQYDPAGTPLAYTEADDVVMQKLTDMQTRYSRLKERLAAASNRIALVCNPDQLSLKESQRLLDGAHELGLSLHSLLTNKVTAANTALAAAIEGELLGGRGDIRHQRIPLQTELTGPDYRHMPDLTTTLGFNSLP